MNTLSLNELSFFNMGREHIVLILLGGSSALLGIITNFLIYKFLQRYLLNHKKVLLNIFFSAIHIPLYIIFFLMYFDFFSAFFNFKHTAVIIHLLVKILFIVAIAWGGVKLMDYANILLDYYRKKGKNEADFQIIFTRVQMLKNVLKAGIIVLSLSLILLNFPELKEVGKGILISAGVFSTILIFAAQHIFSNFFSGMQLVFNRPVRIGDLLTIEQEQGVVESLTLTQVSIRTWDNRLIIYPLSYLMERPFQNLTYPSTDLTGPIFFYMDYNINVGKVREFLKETVASNPLWDGKIMNLQVTDMQPNSLQLRAVVSARNNADLWALRCEIREKIAQYIKENFPEYLPKYHAQITR